MLILQSDFVLIVLIGHFWEIEVRYRRRLNLKIRDMCHKKTFHWKRIIESIKKSHQFLI